jgi:hypothetical protein
MDDADACRAVDTEPDTNHGYSQFLLHSIADQMNQHLLASVQVYLDIIELHRWYRREIPVVASFLYPLSRRPPTVIPEFLSCYTRPDKRGGASLRLRIRAGERHAIVVE